VFLDMDSELLAPRYRAAEEVLALLARAARLVGGRGEGVGRVVVQTRLPDHVVLRAASLGDPDRVVQAELERREAMRLPPMWALASVSGAGADAVVDHLRADDRVQVGGPAGGPYLVRAPTSEQLADALADVPRPEARVRIEVDPLRA
jgi:primosomal protein N' (replication factor Y)